MHVLTTTTIITHSLTNQREPHHRPTTAYTAATPAEAHTELAVSSCPRDVL